MAGLFMPALNAGSTSVSALEIRLLQSIWGHYLLDVTVPRDTNLQLCHK